MVLLRVVVDAAAIAVAEFDAVAAAAISDSSPVAADYSGNHC